MKTIFLSFANSVYVPSLRRLEEQIRSCPLINEFHFLTNKDLDDGFKKHFHPYIYIVVAMVIGNGNRIL